MSRFVPVSLALLIFAAGARPAGARGIVVKPDRLRLSGASRSGRLSVTGTTSEKTRVRVRVEDFVLSEDGKPQRSPGVSGTHSAAADVLVDPVDFTLEGGREETILVTWNPRPGAPGDRWALIVFDVEGTPVVDAGGRHTMVASRILVPLIAAGNAGSRRELRLLELSAERIDAGNCAGRAVVENAGDSVLEPAAEWTLFHRTAGGTEELARKKGSPVLLLPGGRRLLEMPLDCASAARDLGILLSVQYGDGPKDRIQATADVTSSEPPRRN